MKAAFLKPGISVPPRAGSQLQGTPVVPRQSRRRKSLAIAYEAGPGDGAEPRRARWEPPRWREQLQRIRQMRSGRDAPVDEMGVHRCYDSSAPPEVTAVPQGMASMGNSIPTGDNILLPAPAGTGEHSLPHPRAAPGSVPLGMFPGQKLDQDSGLGLVPEDVMSVRGSAAFMELAGRA